MFNPHVQRSQQSGPDVLFDLKASQSQPVTVFYAAATIFIFVLATRLPYVRQPSLWIDEVFSIFYAHKGLGAIWGADWRVEPTPPLYYTFLAFWRHVAGWSEPLYRLPSVILSCFAGAAIVYAGANLRSWTTGVLAGLLWSSMPLALEYSLEIRAYSLQLLEVALLLATLLRMMRYYDAERLDLPAFWRHAVALTGLGVLSAYTHATSIYMFAGVSGAAFLFFCLRRNWGLAGLWVGCNALFSVAIIPQLLASRAVVMNNAATLAWLPHIDLTSVHWTFRALFIGLTDYSDAMNALFVLPWFALLVFGLWRLRRDAPVILACAVAPVIGCGLLIVGSLFEPALLPRTVMWSAIPLALLVAATLTSLRSRMLCTALVLCWSPALWHVATDHMQARDRGRQNYENLKLIAHDGPNPVVVAVDGENACIMRFYGLPENRVRVLDLGPRRVFKRTQAVDLGCNTPPRVGAADIKHMLAQGETVWVLAGPGRGVTRWGDIDELARETSGAAEISRKIQDGDFNAIRLTRPRT